MSPSFLPGRKPNAFVKQFVNMEKYHDYVDSATYVLLVVFICMWY